MAAMRLMIINGQQVAAASGETMQVINPADRSVVDTVPKAGVEDTRKAIEAAAAAFPKWSAMPAHERASIMLKTAAHVREHLEDVAKLLTAEQGKPLRDSHIEADRFAAGLEQYAGLVAGGHIKGEQMSLPQYKAMGLVVRRPMGVVGAIIPWNFPLTLFANKIAPALAVGNTCVAKPASTTPLSTLKLAELMQEAGLPEGVLNVVTGPGGVVGEELVRHPLVRKIGFTGETVTGQKVMASAALEIKRVTLELGGSDPAIVCDDADVELAAKSIAIGRFFNAGQACLAVKRVYVQRPVAEEFIEKIAGRAQRLKVGNGSDPQSQMGPMHTENGRAGIESQLKDAVERGGKVVAGGGRPEGDGFDQGFFIQPTVIVDVPEQARVWKEETFGPLLPVMVVEDFDEALRRANDTEYGLGSSIFTRDFAKAQRAIDDIQAGYTWVNSIQVAYDELPFGGWKHSGYGKEHGTDVLNYYTEEKSVILAGV
jgi:acyl-CoA reductase-like NAD-dependent aldehyde dehydrogenase